MTVRCWSFINYGMNFITSHGISQDVFVQMTFQMAHFGLYGKHFNTLGRGMMSEIYCEQVELNALMHLR